MRLTCLVLFAILHAFGSECTSEQVDPAEARAKLEQLDRKAQVEFRHEEFSPAAENFRRAACFAPDAIRPYYSLYGTAVTNVVDGNFARAKQALQEADRLRPDYPLPLAMLAKVSLVFGQLDALKETLQAIGQRFPHNGRLHAELAQDLVHHKDYDLALAEALRVEHNGLEDSAAMVTLAALENEAGAFSDAFRLAAAVEQQSELPAKTRASAAEIAGLACESDGRFQQAIEHLEHAIQLVPDHENTYLALARICASQQHFSEAVNFLQQGRRCIPNSPALMLALGSNLIAAEDYVRAQQILEELVRSFPDLVEAYPKLSETYRAMGQLRLATQTLQRLAARTPDHPMIHVAVAESILQENPVDYSAVFDELTKAEKASPNDYDVYYLRGRAYIAMKRYAEAIASLRHAVELRPLESGARYQLGLAYRRSGQVALAEEEFQRLRFLKSQTAP
ncbi:MAG: tetratricopeptide repeat protein [Bryobacteraceae bacterium]